MLSVAYGPEDDANWVLPLSGMYLIDHGRHQAHLNRCVLSSAYVGHGIVATVYCCRSGGRIFAPTCIVETL